VDCVRFWRPSPGKRISLVDVEADIIRIAKSYRLPSVKIDEWQAVGLEERLRRAGVPATLVTLGPTQLDKLATTLKATFADRLITIPAHPPELREQLESRGRGNEGRNSRRDLVRFQSGKGAGAASHDDAVSLALTIESSASQIGVPVMPPLRVCNQIAAGNSAARRHGYLLGGEGILCGEWLLYVPSRADLERLLEARTPSSLKLQPTHGLPKLPPPPEG
jgi:hypothetical protein